MKASVPKLFGCPGAAAPPLPGLSRLAVSRRPQKPTTPSALASLVVGPRCRGFCLSRAVQKSTTAASEALGPCRSPIHLPCRPPLTSLWWPGICQQSVLVANGMGWLCSVRDSQQQAPRWGGLRWCGRPCRPRMHTRNWVVPLTCWGKRSS